MEAFLQVIASLQIQRMEESLRLSRLLTPFSAMTFAAKFLITLLVADNHQRDV